MFNNYFVSTSKLTHSSLHSSHNSLILRLALLSCLLLSIYATTRTCHLSRVSKFLSIIPPKSCCLDYIPTVTTKRSFSAFSDPIAYLVNLSFSQGTFLSKLIKACSCHFTSIHLSLPIFNLSLHVISILCSQPIANITLLKPLSIIFSIL